MEQQHQQGVHPDILEYIDNPRQYIFGGSFMPIAYVSNINRPSVEYLADFLREEEEGQEVTNLWFEDCTLDESDAVNALCDLFANSTTLTCVTLCVCRFGSVHNVSQILAALLSNRLISVLGIHDLENLPSADLANCIASVLVLNSNPHIQRPLRAMQPATGLRPDRHLKELNISFCNLQDEGLGLIADALVGNTTMETLDIGYDDSLSSNSLAHITKIV
jgi:hypothetical protein